MGRPKATLEIAGRSILQFLLERFSWAGPTLLVTSPGRENPPGWELFSRQAVDANSGEGPLRGVLTALEYSTTAAVIITTVDMPGIEANQLRWIAERGVESQSVGLMLRRDRIEPFPLYLRLEGSTVVSGRLSEGKSSVNQLSEIPGFLTLPVPSDWPESVWKNLNTPEDVKTLWQNQP